MKPLLYVLICIISISSCDGLAIANSINDNIPVSGYTGNDLVMQLYLRNSKIASFRAYREEPAEVAIWALNNYAMQLGRKPLVEISKMQYRDMQIDLGLTWARLSILSKKKNKNQLHKKYIHKSLALIEELNLIKSVEANEEELLNLLRKIDNSTKIQDY